MKPRENPGPRNSEKHRAFSPKPVSPMPPGTTAKITVPGGKVVALDDVQTIAQAVVTDSDDPPAIERVHPSASAQLRAGLDRHLEKIVAEVTLAAACEATRLHFETIEMDPAKRNRWQANYASLFAVNKVSTKEMVQVAVGFFVDRAELSDGWIGFVSSALAAHPRLDEDTCNATLFAVARYVAFVALGVLDESIEVAQARVDDLEEKSWAVLKLKKDGIAKLTADHVTAMRVRDLSRKQRDRLLTHRALAEATSKSTSPLIRTACAKELARRTAARKVQTSKKRTRKESTDG